MRLGLRRSFARNECEAAAAGPRCELGLASFALTLLFPQEDALIVSLAGGH